MNILTVQKTPSIDRGISHLWYTFVLLVPCAQRVRGLDRGCGCNKSSSVSKVEIPFCIWTAKNCHLWRSSWPILSHLWIIDWSAVIGDDFGLQNNLSFVGLNSFESYGGSLFVFFCDQVEPRTYMYCIVIIIILITLTTIIIIIMTLISIIMTRGSAHPCHQCLRLVLWPLQFLANTLRGQLRQFGKTATFEGKSCQF